MANDWPFQFIFHFLIATITFLSLKQNLCHFLGRTWQGENGWGEKCFPFVLMRALSFREKEKGTISCLTRFLPVTRTLWLQCLLHRLEWVCFHSTKKSCVAFQFYSSWRERRGYLWQNLVYGENDRERDLKFDWFPLRQMQLSAPKTHFFIVGGVIKNSDEQLRNEKNQHVNENK